MVVGLNLNLSGEICRIVRLGVCECDTENEDEKRAEKRRMNK